MAVFDDVGAAYQKQLDNEMTDGIDDDMQCALAAAAYAEHAAIWADTTVDLQRYRAAGPNQLWPWSTQNWSPQSPRADLVRAAALIISQIEKIDRAENPEDGTHL